MAPWLDLSEEVRAALEAGKPVVALESTVIAHGLPWPNNFETALAMEAKVRSSGALPATIGLVAGRAVVGLTAESIEQFAKGEEVSKASSRDIAGLMAKGESGATTVAATLVLAHAAGIKIMATGGIGGVHRNFNQTGDESTDLSVLGRVPVTVVASGAKCILDLPLTLERLETYGVAVAGYQTDEFPAFYFRDSGLKLDREVVDLAAAARLEHWTSMTRLGGLLLANPIPDEAALPREDIEELVHRAEREANSNGIEGKALTPFLLGRLAEYTQGQSLVANRVLLTANAALAGQIASRLPSYTD